MQRSLRRSSGPASLPVSSPSSGRLPPSTLPAPTSSSAGDNFFHFFPFHNYFEKILLSRLDFPKGSCADTRENLLVQDSIPSKSQNIERERDMSLSIANSQKKCCNRRSEPEPLHHDKGILAICIILVNAKHRAVSHALVEPLRCRVGHPHFQLYTGSKFQRELVLDPVHEEFSDSLPPVTRINPEVAEMTVDILPGVFEAPDNKTLDCAVADCDKISGWVIRECFVEDRVVPRVYE